MTQRPEHRRRRPLAVLALVVALVATAFGVVVRAPSAVGATPATSVQGAPSASVGPAVTLLGQSTWVGGGKVFTLRLGLSRGLLPADRIVVTAYSRLTNRTDFDQAADGRYDEEAPEWIGEETVGAAPRSPQGGVWARIPVNVGLSGGDLVTTAPFELGAESGVYPLQVQVVGPDSAAIGRDLSTFLVYRAGQDGFPPLATSVTVPVGAAPALSSKLVLRALSPSASAALSTLSSVLAAHAGVPLSLTVSPQTAEALASGSPADRATLQRLAALVRRRDELLPAPYVPVSLAGLDAAGLDDEVTSQLQEGSAVLSSTLGVTPAMSTWVIDGPIDDATLQLLHGDGLRQLVIAETALSPLPTDLVVTTYGRPTALDDGAAARLRVMGADATLAGRAASPAQPVLAAEQTLAELAMIRLETPSIPRGAAISLPGTGAVATPYLSTLLAGLQDNPFVEPVTAARLLAAVAEEPAGSTHPTTGSPGPTGGAVPVRTLRPAVMAGVPAAAALQSLHVDIGGLSGLLPGDTVLIGRLRRQLLIVPAAGLAPAQRNALLAAMNGAIRSVESSVHLPGATSVTLTSLRATLPLVVLSNAKLSPHVRLTLDSPKLGFRPFRPPDGTCQVSGPSSEGNGRTSEVCYLVLHGPQTTLRVPVDARTSGVFSLDVAITSPDGSLMLATARDTVRSTAVSFVGLVIIVVSVLFLGIWWIRDIRSGRRARQLVRRPGDDIDDDGDGSPGGGVGPSPPSRPVGPSEPVEPRRQPPPPPTIADPAVPVGAGPNTVRANRSGRHHARHRGDAPTRPR